MNNESGNDQYKSSEFGYFFLHNSVNVSNFTPADRLGILQKISKELKLFPTILDVLVFQDIRNLVFNREIQEQKERRSTNEELYCKAFGFGLIDLTKTDVKYTILFETKEKESPTNRSFFSQDYVLMDKDAEIFVINIIFSRQPGSKMDDIVNQVVTDVSVFGVENGCYAHNEQKLMEILKDDECFKCIIKRSFFKLNNRLEEISETIQEMKVLSKSTKGGIFF